MVTDSKGNKSTFEIVFNLECPESTEEILDEILKEVVVEEGVDYSYRETDWYVDAYLTARFSGIPFVEPV